MAIVVRLKSFSIPFSAKLYTVVFAVWTQMQPSVEKEKIQCKIVLNPHIIWMQWK